MANPRRGEVEVEVGGKTRTLKFDMNALADVSSHCGVNRMTDFIDLAQDPSPTHLRYLLWAGLKHDDPKLKLGTVGTWEFPYLIVMVKIQEAVMCALNGGEPVGGDEDNEEVSEEESPL